MKILKSLETPSAIRGSVECSEIRFDRNILNIILTDESGKELYVRFDSVVSFRWIDEGDALAIIHALNESDFIKSAVVVVTDSEFLKWLDDQSYGSKGYCKLVHVVVLTSNDIIEVIAWDDPILEVGDK